ncbi:hypothetical protein [Rhizobium tumorigenes]|uniref:Uncharacterized protein n=1 Tax=Rhizobium tumorigenes TaxID=2041385 RepID=A0AAF1KT67_9HYPH|nr:hypothetical protein [Rhizobium tumorigenes]WFR96820.1 hypothetical protein PR017_06805 [Rhizobium tumorigenes]
MLFGQSIFQSVLDRLDAEDEEAVFAQSASAHRIQGLNSSFAADVRDGVSVSEARPDQAYLDNLGPEREPPAPETPSIATRDIEPEKCAAPVMPVHLARILPQEVAAELGISAADTLQTLNDKRRSFAKVNHPDGVNPLFKEQATTRMKIANLLIDEALRRIEIRARLFK